MLCTVHFCVSRLSLSSIVDGAFPGACPQAEFYRAIGPGIVSTLFEGHDASVIVHGCKDTGKTYTLVGSEDEPGIIPRVMMDVFRRMGGRDSYVCGVSCWETDPAGLDGVVDLLEPEPSHPSLAKMVDPVVRAGSCASVGCISIACANCLCLLLSSLFFVAHDHKITVVHNSEQFSDVFSTACERSRNWERTRSVQNISHTVLRVILFDKILRRCSALHIVDMAGFDPHHLGRVGLAVFIIAWVSCRS